MANSVRLGGARVDLSGTDSQFQAVMRRAGRAFARQEQQLKKLRQQAALTNKVYSKLRGGVAGLAVGLGAGLGLSGLVQAGRDAADFSTKIVEGARNTGLLATELEAVAAILEQDGIGFKATTTALSTFQKQLAEAKSGLSTATRALEDVGLAVEDFAGMTPRQQLVLYFEALARVTDQTTAQRSAQALLGRAGKEIVGTVREGVGQWDAWITKVDEATKATVGTYEELKKLTGAFTELDRQIQDMRARTLAKHVDDVIIAAEAWEKWHTVILKVEGAFARLATVPTPDPLEALDFELRGFLQAREKLEAEIASGPSVARQWLENLLGTEGDWQAAKEENLARLNDIIASMQMRAANLRADQEADAWGGIPTLGGGAAPTPPPAAELGDIPGMGRLDRQGWEDQIHGAERVSKAIIQLEMDKAVAAEEVVRKQVEAARRARQANIEAAQEAQRAWESSAKSIENALARSIGDFVTGLSSAKDAFRSFASAVIQEMVRIQAAKAATGLLGLFSGFGGVVGTFGPGTPANAFSGGLAAGGPAKAGNAYLVGERGPELFVPRQSGTVVPNGAMGRSVVVNITLNNQSSDGPGVQAALAAAAPAIAQAAQEGVMNTLARPGLGRRFALGGA